MEKLFILKNDNEFIIFENVTSPADFLSNCKTNFNNNNLLLIEVDKLSFNEKLKNCDKYELVENSIHILKYETVTRNLYLKWTIDLDDELILKYFSSEEIEKINENKIYYASNSGDINFPNVIEDKVIGDSTECELKFIDSVEVLNVWS